MGYQIKYRYTIMRRTNRTTVFDGTAQECADFLGIAYCSFLNHVAGDTHKNYIFKRKQLTEEEIKAYEENKLTVKETRDLKTKNKDLDCVLRHLGKYGNTIICKNKKYILEQLDVRKMEYTVRKSNFGGYLIVELTERG